MKQLSIALNVMLLVLVGILFYFHFQDKKASPKVLASQVSGAKEEAPPVGAKIGYFEMDSLQANYHYFKDALSQLKQKEQSMNAELAGFERTYQQKVSEWQKKGAAMSQSEADAAQRENAQMQQSYQSRKQALEESFGKQSMEFKKDIKKKIEEYLKEYNKNKAYTYILSYEPDFIFLRDSSCNITNDLVAGLNEQYKKK